MMMVMKVIVMTIVAVMISYNEEGDYDDNSYEDSLR